MLSHLLSAFLDHPSHALPSFLFRQNSAIAFPLTLFHRSLRLETEGRGNQRGVSLRNLPLWMGEEKPCTT
jgi:hypothetical protein